MGTTWSISQANPGIMTLTTTQEVPPHSFLNSLPASPSSLPVIYLSSFYQPLPSTLPTIYSDVACCEYCMCVCLLPLPCTACCLAKGKRKDLRRKYGLKGGSDCMAHACCSCCALCQEAREISYRAPGMAAAERMASGTSNNSNPGSPHGAYTAPQPQTFIQLPAANQVAQVPNLPGHQIVQLPSGQLAYVPIVMQKQPMAPASCGGSGVSRSLSGGGGGRGSGTYPPPPGHQKNPSPAH
jgi:Cys-rich protein (TIGR01571 family)